MCVSGKVSGCLGGVPRGVLTFDSTAADAIGPSLGVWKVTTADGDPDVLLPTLLPAPCTDALRGRKDVVPLPGVPRPQPLVLPLENGCCWTLPATASGVPGCIAALPRGDTNCTAPTGDMSGSALGGEDAAWGS